MRHCVDLHLEGLSALVGLGADDAVDLADDLRKADRLAVQTDLTGLDLAHIQYIVNQAEQVLAGKLSLVYIGHFTSYV